jgi:rubredoxin
MLPPFVYPTGHIGSVIPGVPGVSSHDGWHRRSRSFGEHRHSHRIMTFRSLFDRWSQILARGGAFRTEPSAAMCPRCGTASTGFLGQARSSVDWFACHGCSYVWSLANPLPINTEHVSCLGHTRVLTVDDDTTVVHALQLALATCGCCATRSTWPRD